MKSILIIIRIYLPSWLCAGEHYMPLEGLVGPKHGVGAMEVVQDTQHPIAVGELEVVEVMSLGGGEEGKVVAGVGVECVG